MEEYINDVISEAKVKLHNSNIRKSGFNKHANFYYYELSDFLPTLIVIQNELKINDIFSIQNDEAVLSLEWKDQKKDYKMPFEIFEVPKNLRKDKNGNFMKEGESFLKTPQMQQIQYLGAINTYYKRYLYLNAYGLTDGEVIDASMMRPVWWDQAINYLRSQDGTIEQIEKKYSITKEMKQALMDEAANG